MTSLTISERRIELDAFNPEIIRAAIRAGQKNGSIKVCGKSNEPSAPLTAADIRAIAEEARGKGILKPGVSPSTPATIARSGKLATEAEGVLSQWILVTPEIAAHWIQNNFVNRPVSEDVVSSYARDMLRDQWVQTHQGIAFNDLDHLIDGQHRLLAIIKSGKTIAMMVTFGLPSKIKGREMTTMDAVDRGRTRSVADQLRIQHGMKQGAPIAAITAAISNLCYNARTRRLSVGQTLEIYRMFQESIDWIIKNRPTESGLKNTGVLAAFAFARTANPEEREAISKLFDFLVQDDWANEGMPIFHLREFLLSDDAKLLSRGTHRGVAELVLETIRLSLAGETVSELTPSSAGLEHFRAMIPEPVSKVTKIFSLKS